jgi:hypothetical protein
MNSDEVNWLLQTIEDPENAKRFVQAQCQRGRIPYHVMASLARDRNWTDWPAVEKPAALISMECIRLAERKSCMTNFETTAADQAVREIDVEEFDPVILGDGTG